VGKGDFRLYRWRRDYNDYFDESYIQDRSGLLLIDHVSDQIETNYKREAIAGMIGKRMKKEDDVVILIGMVKEGHDGRERKEK